MSINTPIASGPSYSLPAKGLACGLVLLVAVTAWRAWPQLGGPELVYQRLTLGAGVVWLLIGLCAILRSRTAVHATCIVQRGLWRRCVAYSEITHVKLVHWPWLSWLVAPRLVVKLRGGGTATFFARDVDLLQRVARATY